VGDNDDVNDDDGDDWNRHRILIRGFKMWAAVPAWGSGIIFPENVFKRIIDVLFSELSVELSLGEGHSESVCIFISAY